MAQTLTDAARDGYGGAIEAVGPHGTVILVQPEDAAGDSAGLWSVYVSGAGWQHRLATREWAAQVGVEHAVRIGIPLKAVRWQRPSPARV